MAFGNCAFSRSTTASALSFSPSEMRPSATFDPSSGDESHAGVSLSASASSFPGSPISL